MAIAQSQLLPAPAPPASPAAPPLRAEAAASGLPISQDQDSADEGFVYVMDQDLRSFLADAGRRFGLRTDIAPGVRGRLSRLRLPARPHDLLRDIATRYEIEWTLEGDLLRVVPRSEVVTRIISLGDIDFDSWLKEAKSAGLDTVRYPPSPMLESKAVILTAPASLIGRLEAVLEAMKHGKDSPKEMNVIRAGVSQTVKFD